MRGGQRAWQLALAVMAVVGLLGGCTCPTRRGAQAAGGWTLQFSDDFNRDELGEDWEAVAGDWRLQDGQLLGGQVGKSGENTVICARLFPGSQRVEFDAVTVDPQPCDLSGLLGVNRGGLTTGYFFGFGSDNNRGSKLLIESKRDVERYDAVIVPGQLHHVVCEREGNVLRHIIDGKVAVSYTDDPPLKGNAHEMIGFYIFTSGQIDNVKVYTKPGD